MTNTATLNTSNNTNNCGKLKYILRTKQREREREILHKQLPRSLKEEPTDIRGTGLTDPLHFSRQSDPRTAHAPPRTLFTPGGFPFCTPALHLLLRLSLLQSSTRRGSVYTPPPQRCGNEQVITRPSRQILISASSCRAVWAPT